jgi:hypothetical protein
MTTGRQGVMEGWVDERRPRNGLQITPGTRNQITLVVHYVGISTTVTAWVEHGLASTSTATPLAERSSNVDKSTITYLG